MTATQRERKFESLQRARTLAPPVDWHSVKPTTPSFLGSVWPARRGAVRADHRRSVRVINEPLAALVDYIDWNPFFATWQLRGRCAALRGGAPTECDARRSFPNRGYPNIFNDADVGKQAKSLFDEAQTMLKKIIDEKSVFARTTARCVWLTRRLCA